MPRKRCPRYVDRSAHLAAPHRMLLPALEDRAALPVRWRLVARGDKKYRRCGDNRFLKCLPDGLFSVPARPTMSRCLCAIKMAESQGRAAVAYQLMGCTPKRQ